MSAFVPFKPFGPDEAPHPAAVDESQTLAAIRPRQLPDVSDLLIDPTPLSTLQRETVALIQAAFARGRGFLLGDSTGLGKGRMCAATLLEGQLRAPVPGCLGVGSTTGARGLWVSTSAPLFQDARRDVAAVDTGGVLEWWDGRTGNLRYCTYPQLVASPEEFSSWLRAAGADATLVLDEVHAANNVKTKTAQTVSSLQLVCPRARVLYSTATSASRLEHLSFLHRLGLWGPGAPFDTFVTLDQHLKRFACSATELLAIYMKQEGMYVSRSLSMRGVDIDLCTVRLTPSQRRLYDECARRWHEAGSQAGTDRQRFFLALITAFKMPAAIQQARAAVQAGLSVVIGVQGTGEANSQECKRSAGARSGDLLLSGPPSQLRGLMCRAGVACRDLALPLDPLDAVVEAFGADQVAELTGRTVRALPGAGEWRWGGKPSIDAERTAFQRDERSVAVLSRAASTGISLHAHEAGSRPRLHITVELPWSCERLVQQSGRSHRAGQTSLPQYRVMVTDAPAELRFVSTVASRLQQLGALKHGDRDAAAAQSGSELLRMHTESGVTFECLRRAALALLALRLGHRLDATGPVRYGAVNYELLGQNADRAGHHAATATVRGGYRAVQGLWREVEAALAGPGAGAGAGVGAAAISGRLERLRDRYSNLMATLVTAVPAVRFAVLREGRLEVEGRVLPARWTAATHRYFPHTFRRAVRSLLLGSIAPEAATTLGRLSHDVKHSIVERMGRECLGPDRAALAVLKDDAALRAMGSGTLDNFLNGVLCLPIGRQRRLIGAVAACAEPGDRPTAAGVQTLERLLLPASRARHEEFCIEVDEPEVDATRDLLKVGVRVLPNPSRRQLAGWREAGLLVQVHYMLNGQLAAVARAPDNPGYVDLWQPGRFHRAKRLTAAQWEHEREQMRLRFMDAGATVRAFGPDDPTADAAWATQTQTYAERLTTEAGRRSRLLTFAYRNPLVSLDEAVDPTVVRIDCPELRFTGLLLRSSSYLQTGAVGRKRKGPP